jgi:hypothetical protein
MEPFLGATDDVEHFKPEQSCHLKDWVVVESGEDVKWKGQVRRLAFIPS